MTWQAVGDEADPIQPSRIEHMVEEIFADGTLAERYNYLVYRFEGHGAHCHARAYLDDISRITVFGPYRPGIAREPMPCPELLADVLTYLRRRYRVVNRG